ncbi:hypothetical protein F2Q68_00024196 [Brassica cretica]|uniref:Uncharacterized protein n=1 Tax=Brassica cretica TaxID=69181 RepID=A0A8S9IFQ2_BRACR|nr:hypothetical protein F2Q68_00024196 [Brassica cretica]
MPISFISDLSTRGLGMGFLSSCDNSRDCTSVDTSMLLQHVWWERCGYYSWSSCFEFIGDARGRGLMLGVELVSDHKLKTPATAETLHIMDQMKELGVLVGKGGFFGNVFRITPPLCFTKDDADYLVEAMDYSVSKM